MFSLAGRIALVSGAGQSVESNPQTAPPGRSQRINDLTCSGHRIDGGRPLTDISQLTWMSYEGPECQHLIECPARHLADQIAHCAHQAAPDQPEQDQRQQRGVLRQPAAGAAVGLRALCRS